MLVLDPHRRYTIEQIKHHRWMLIEVMEPISLACDNQNVPSRNGTTIAEPNEQILRLMAGLGIDTQKTCNSLKVSAQINFNVVASHWALFCVVPCRFVLVIFLCVSCVCVRVNESDTLHEAHRLQIYGVAETVSFLFRTLSFSRFRYFNGSFNEHTNKK